MRATSFAAAAFAAVLAATSALAQEPASPPAQPAPTTAPAPTPAPTEAQLVIGDDDENPSAVIARLPPDVRGRLTGDQVESIIRHSGGRSEDAIAVKVVPTIFFATILGIVIAVVVARNRRDRLMHDTLRAMIEKGTPIPEALLGAGEKRKPDDRRRAIILICAGVGLGAFLFAVDNSDRAWAIGLVPLLIGVGYLVAWFLEKRDAGKA